MNTKHNAWTRAFALVVMAALAAGCGGGGDEPAAKADTAKAAAKAKKAAEAATPSDGMAVAVVVGKTSAAVDLHYNLAAKPAVGQPFEVELAFLPRTAADSLEIETSGMAGLVIASGSAAKFENVVPGERYVSKMLVQVNDAGLYYIAITAKMISKVQSEVRTFSVPVVVGTLPAVEKPTAAAAAQPPGTAVKSVPAVESNK